MPQSLPINTAKRANLRVAAWRRGIKKRAVEYLGSKCLICGYSKCLDALSFHHRDPGLKEFRLGSYAAGWEKLQKELDKCDLLCLRCHAEVHAEWKSSKVLEQEAILAKYNRALLTEVRCAQCSRPKLVPPSRVIRSPRHFCDRTCKGLFYRKGSQKVEVTNRRRITAYPQDTDLCRLVWKIPVRTLAKSLGVTGEALKKWCKRRGIATPPRGYWARVQSLSTNSKLE